MARIYTLGHSTRTAEEFAGLMKEHGVQTAVDVRRFPGSRRYPHFGGEALALALPAAGIAYRHEADLGGRRSARPDSPNTAWRNAAFRGYADYMETAVFREALERLVALAEQAATAVFCAEAVPWRCHRRLIADALVARGHEVVHILGPGKVYAHVLSEDARVLPGHRLVYGPETIQATLL